MDPPLQELDPLSEAKAEGRRRLLAQILNIVMNRVSTTLQLRVGSRSAMKVSVSETFSV